MSLHARVQVDPNNNTDYENITLFTQNTGQAGNQSIPAVSSNNLRLPLVDDISKFKGKIEKFCVPLTSIPLGVFSDNLLAPTNPAYQSNYWIGFSIGPNNTNVLMTNLIWQPINNQPNGIQQGRFFYSYSQFLRILNSAFSTLWATALGNAAYTAVLLADNDQNDYPYVELNDTTSYFRFVLPAGRTNAATPFANRYSNGGINILMSSTLYNKFIGFPANFVFGPAGVNGTNPNLNVSILLNINQTNQQLLVAENFDKTGADADIPNRYVNIVYQDYTNLYNWNEVSRVLFLTSMPVVPETFSYINPTNPGQKYNQVLLTEYDVVPDRFMNQRDKLFYYANGDTRYFNFKGSGPLTLADCYLYFQLNDLSIYPFPLQLTEFMLIKMRLERRTNRKLLEE